MIFYVFFRNFFNVKESKKSFLMFYKIKDIW